MHVLFLVCWATENFVYGPRAFAAVANAHWQALQNLEQKLGIAKIEHSIRNFFMPSDVMDVPRAHTAASAYHNIVGRSGGGGLAPS